MAETFVTLETLDGVPVHYDRLKPPLGYGSEGEPRELKCTEKLKTTLEDCFTELFTVWKTEKPTIILTAGTIGDAKLEHGKGRAFDLDGFRWDKEKFTMDEFPAAPRFYLGINAHLLLHFPQVLSYHYPGHADHMHMDFASTFEYSTKSQAKTSFLQAALRYVYGRDIGTFGPGKDGVDGDYGYSTKKALDAVLADQGLTGKKGLLEEAAWRSFLTTTRDKAFA